jgi:hypothetical protein
LLPTRTNPYVVLARQQHKPGVLELGEPTHVNEMPDGAYVMAWIWIPKPEQIDGDSCAMPLDSAQGHLIDMPRV